MASERGSTHFKCVLLGNAGVGKSCIVLRFTRNEFIADSETTVGAAFLTRQLHLDDCDVKIEIWDTAGQERYRSLAPMYYRGAQAAIVVFDVTSRESFEGAKTWIKELQRRTESGMVVALCGNKTDLAHLRRVDSEEAVSYAREMGLLYVETSAKDSSNIERLFTEVAKRVPRAPSASAAAAKKDAVAVGGGKGAGSGGGGAGGCC